MNKELIEKIREFYKPQLSDITDFFYTVETPRGKKYVSFKGDKKIYLTFGQSISKEEIENLDEEKLKEKGIVVTTEKELGKLLFPEHYATIKPLIEPDERMEKYLNGVKRGIGLIEIKHGWDEENIVPVKKYRIWANLTGDGCVDVGQLDNGLWVAQYSVRTSIDDYDVTRMYFNKLPSKKDVITAATLEDIEIYFDMHGWDEAKFYCFACCRERHFCDVKANSFEQKFSYFRTHYCGCED